MAFAPNVPGFASSASRTKDFVSKCYGEMAGNANAAALCQTLKSITKNFVATPGMTVSRT